MISTTVLYVCLYLFVVLFIGLWARRKETTSEFLIGGRRLGVIEVALSILAVFGGLEVIGQAALAYEVGFSAMWFWVGIALGILLFAFISSKLKRLSSRKRFITLSDYFFSQFNKKSGFLSAAITFITFFALLVGQIIAGASLVSPLLSLSYILSVFLIVAVTLVYLSLGGFKAVTKTDLFQGAVVLVIFTMSGFLFNSQLGDTQKASFSSLGSYGSISLVVIGVFVVFAGADIWQRLYAARNSDVVKKGFSVASLLILLFGLVITFIGVIAKKRFPNINPEEAIFYGFLYLLPQEIFGLGIIVILAAIMSAIDTQIFLLSSTLTKDFIFREKVSKQKLKRYMTISFFIITLVAATCAIYTSNIITLLYGLFSLMLSISPSVICSFFFKLKNNAVSLSMLGGVSSLVVLGVLGVFTPETAVITLPSSIVCLGLGQLIFKK